MKKVIGYLLIVIGFLFVAMSLSSSNPALSNFLPNLGIPSVINSILGVILIAVGLYLTLIDKNSSSTPHASSEVPIYEGEGKDKVIVGYKKTAEVKKKSLLGI